MKQLTTLVLALIGVSLCGCRSDNSDYFLPPSTTSTSPRKKKSPPPPAPSRALAEVAISEAVLRRFTQDASEMLKTKPKEVFLGVTAARVDPDPGFLSRLTGKGLRVLPYSASKISGETNVVAAAQRGLLLTIERIDWLDLYNVQVPCSWSVVGGETRYFSYLLQWNKKKWIMP
jgi:hypothetical protein